MSLRHAAVVALLLVAPAGCTFPRLETPTPRPTASPTPTPTPTASPTPTPTPAPSPTPDLGDVPRFEGAERVETAIDGLRVRQRPGTTSSVITGLLPLGADLEVRMGPIPVGGIGWYLVADADRAEPSFGEGWIAAGFDPEPFLRSTGAAVRNSPVIAAFALTGDAEYGPFEIADENHRIRWMAVDPEREGCRFAVVLDPADRRPVDAIRATIGDGVVPGTLQPTFFASQETIRGQVFLRVDSDCAWTLAVERVRPSRDSR